MLGYRVFNLKKSYFNRHIFFEKKYYSDILKFVIKEVFFNSILSKFCFQSFKLFFKTYVNQNLKFQFHYVSKKYISALIKIE